MAEIDISALTGMISNFPGVALSAADKPGSFISSPGSDALLTIQ
jgi:hypothetical protein